MATISMASATAPAIWYSNSSTSGVSRDANYAAKTQVAGRGVDGLRHARGWTIAAAVIRRAKKRTALHDFSRDLYIRRARIEAGFAFAAARIFHRAAGAFDLAMVLIPVGGPLPHVAGHVVQAVPVRRKRTDRCRPLEAVFEQVLPGKCALPVVGHRLPAGHVLVAPGKFRAFQSAARREFPLRFGGQFLACPFRIGLGIFERDVHYRMAPQSLQRTCGSTRMLPVGTRDIDPPVVVISKINRTGGFLEHHGGG